jgi:predicted nucleic acid-binding protein
MALPLTVVDTTVIIDILRGFQPAIEWVESIERRLVASEVTRIEVLRGLRSHERGAAERAFAALRWIAVDESIARRAGELGRRWRRSYRSLSLADLVIGSTAIEFGAELATSNVRHYPMFPNLRPPYDEATGTADTNQGRQRRPDSQPSERIVGTGGRDRS